MTTQPTPFGNVNVWRKWLYVKQLVHILIMNFPDRRLHLLHTYTKTTVKYWVDTWYAVHLGHLLLDEKAAILHFLRKREEQEAPQPAASAAANSPAGGASAVLASFISAVWCFSILSTTLTPTYQSLDPNGDSGLLRWSYRRSSGRPSLRRRPPHVKLQVAECVLQACHLPSFNILRQRWMLNSWRMNRRSFLAMV
jgi:hypothetical protein